MKLNKETMRVMHLLQTLAQVLQNNWSPVVEAFIFFADLEGRVMPQPSQGLLSLFFAHETYIDKTKFNVFWIEREQFISLKI